ncbi:unnamed protein product [Rhodiola kirilowii]
MHKEVKLSMVGVMNHCLGLQVKQKDDGTLFSQSKYIKILIKHSDLEKAGHKSTSAAIHLKTIKDDAGTKTDQTIFRSMIGSLLYSTASRPDLAFADIGIRAKCQADLKENHLLQEKRITKYACREDDLEFWYTKDHNPHWVGDCDADWAGNVEDRKNTSGSCFLLGNTLDSQFSKKENSISLSTVEAEYITVGSCSTQLLWMKQMLSEYGVEQKEMTLYCENMSAISICKNPVQYSRTKHIYIRHHFIRELVEQKVVTLNHVTTYKQLADILTKPLDAAQFETLRSFLGLCVVKH